MDAKQLNQKLRRLGACSEAVEWAKGKSFAEAWMTCERGDWMLWLCARMAGAEGWPSRQKIVLFACDRAETVLPIFEKRYPQDDRPRKAIETARAWAKGESAAAAAAAAAAAYAAAAAAAAYAAAAAAAAAPRAAPPSPRPPARPPPPRRPRRRRRRRRRRLRRHHRRRRRRRRRLRRRRR